MTDDLPTGYRFCPRAERLVRTGKTEGECRYINLCGDAPCPLEAELRRPGPDQMIDMIGSAFALRPIRFLGR